MDIKIAANTNDILGEGVIWNHKENALYWVDAFAPAIRRLDYHTNKIESWNTKEIIGSLVFDNNGKIIAGTESGFVSISLNPWQKDILINPQKNDGIIFNDGKCDRKGRYFVGTMHKDFIDNEGILWQLDKDLNCRKIDDNITVSNGLAFSPDNKIMYFADTRKDLVYKYDYNLEEGIATNKSIFLSTSNRIGRVDGATVDISGNYWAALIHESAIVCFSPEGKEINKIELPVKHPTMCTFGGPNLDRLYIVTSRKFLKHNEINDLAGSLFYVDGLNTKGIEETFFGG